MRKGPYVFSLVLVLALLISACAPQATPESVVQRETVVVEQTVMVEPTPMEAEPVTISYFTFSAAPDHLEDLDQMIQAFEAANPGIQVEVETAPFNEYFTKLQTLIAGGEAPDVFELNFENFVSFAEKGVLLDLSAQSEMDGEFDANIYYPRAYEAFNRNGRQFGLPETFSTVVLFYNQDMFDAAGVNYPSSDWTWDEAVAAAEQLTDEEAGAWGLFSPIQFWEFYKKAAQNECSFFNEDMTEVTVNAPECVEALETMLDFVDQGVMPTDADMGGVSDGDMFAAGQIAMDVTGIWMFSAFEEAPFSWDIAVEPGMETQATHFFANGVSVFAATEHPEAAWKWVKFFTSSPEMADIRIESGWELPTLDQPEYVDGYLSQSPPENREAVFESLNYAITPPVIERQGEMQDIVNGLIEQAKLGQLTPQQALDQAKVEIEGLMQ